LPTATPTPSPYRPSPTVASTRVPTPWPSAIATPDGSATRRESDAFWNYWADEPHAWLTHQAASLEDNVGLAHLVVRGHMTDVYVGEMWDMGMGPAVPITYVRVAIGEVLKGSPISRTDGFVEVGLGTVSNEVLDDLRARLPQHDNVWFLMSDEALSPRSPANETEIAPYAYVPSNDLQGVLRSIDGRVRVIKPAWIETFLGEDHFPLLLQGTNFAELVEEVRETSKT